MKKTIKTLVVVLLVSALAFCTWVYLSTFHPAPVEEVVVHNSDSTPQLKAGQTLSLLSWNVQFMAGNRNNHFFYDNGPDPWPDANTVETVTREIAEFLREQDADIVMLQEVDDLAARTHLRDQTQALLSYLPQYTAYTETFYWKAAYLPHPAIQGRVGMKLVVLSKYRLEGASRHALSSITTDDLLTRQFNLKRAMLQAQLAVEGGPPLTIINTHLSAFAQGSDTMTRQIKEVMTHLNALPEGTPWILGGDFNLLPNEAALTANAKLRGIYSDKGTELAPLIGRFPSIPPLAAIETNPEPWYTYMSPTDPERRPNRTIDYIFHAPELRVSEGAVLRGKARKLSDHLPLTVELSL